MGAAASCGATVQGPPLNEVGTFLRETCFLTHRQTRRYMQRFRERSVETLEELHNYPPDLWPSEILPAHKLLLKRMLSPQSIGSWYLHRPPKHARSHESVVDYSFLLDHAVLGSEPGPLSTMANHPRLRHMDRDMPELSPCLAEAPLRLKATRTEAQLGARHIETLVAQEQLAICCAQCGKVAEAETLLQWIVEVMNSHEDFGPIHRRTQHAMKLLLHLQKLPATPKSPVSNLRRDRDRDSSPMIERNATSFRSTHSSGSASFRSGSSFSQRLYTYPQWVYSTLRGAS